MGENKEVTMEELEKICDKSKNFYDKHIKECQEKGHSCFFTDFYPEKEIFKVTGYDSVSKNVVNEIFDIEDISTILKYYVEDHKTKDTAKSIPNPFDTLKKVIDTISKINKRIWTIGCKIWYIVQIKK